MKQLFKKFNRCLLYALLAVTTLLFVPGCKKENQVIKTTLSFKIQFASTSVVVQQPNPIEIDHITGVGTNVPFGKCTFVADATFDLSAPSPLPLTGPQIITTESGDKIFSTMQTYSPDPDAAGNVIVVGNETITGGTGKYANATGSFSLYVKGNINSPSANNVMEGSIIY